MLTYQEALDYLYSFVDYSATHSSASAETYDLDRIVQLMDRLGNPQERYRCVHVAGTKGKGSVAALCASTLQAAGYRTGLNTSPHLQDFCERAQIDGGLIPRARVREIVDGLRPVAEQMPGLTTFELTTAMAFQYFAEENIDVAVIEVGLGGRLDATNIITPLVSAITSISRDHTQLLGSTLAEIAGEKAGIIKPGVPVVLAPQREEAQATLERIAAERGAPCSLVGREWLSRPVSHSLDGQAFEIWSAEEQRQLNALRAQGHEARWKPTRLETPLLGLHQVENGSVAYAALNTVRRAGLPVADDAIAEGFRNVRWPGRFEILQRRPYVVADGAHNRDSARKLVSALDEYFAGLPMTLVFGASSDKDVAGILEELLPRAARAVFTQAAHPRAKEPAEMASLAEAYHVPAEVVQPVAEALTAARQSAAPDTVVLACGSLFVAAEARAAFGRRPTQDIDQE
jgi:dihydrofolate synthase / folylpolyglutamate synthase